MIYALEGLRGAAALLVALFHAWESTFTDLPLIRQGWLFVDLFFVISGYVMAHVYQEHLNTRTELAAFAIKRFGRLYPLHIATLVGFILCEFALQAIKLIGALGTNPPKFDLLEPWSFFSNVLLLHGIGFPGARPYNGPSWSISAEMWTYLLFATTVFFATRRTRATVWAMASLAGIGLWLHAGLEDTRTGKDFFRCIYELFLGALLPALRQRIRTTYRSASIFQLAACLATIAVVLHVGDHRKLEYLAPLIFAALVLSLSLDFGVLADALRVTPLQKLGQLSYSVYLTHYSVLVFFNPVGHAIPEPYKSLLTVVYVAVVLGLSELTFRCIEAPWRRHFGRLAENTHETGRLTSGQRQAAVPPN